MHLRPPDTYISHALCLNHNFRFSRQLKGIDFTHTADLFGDGNIDDDDDDDDDDDGDDSFDDDGYDEMDVSVIVPTVLGPIHFDPGGTDVLTREWRLGQDLTSTPVKYTIPGPMTIVELCASKYSTLYSHHCSMRRVLN